MRHFKICGQTVVSVFLTGQVLLLLAMAASPALHERIHHDADQPGHECAVTMFAHGQVEAANVEIPTAFSAVVFAATPPIVFSCFSPAIQNLPAGRAPPV